MIVYRHADTRLPFLWESSGQPAARWHADDEGPVQYFSETPDGAWAEFLRHEEITAPSAALAAGTPSGWEVDGGMRPGPIHGERTIALFGRRPDLTGWCACAAGRPRADLLSRVHPFG